MTNKHQQMGPGVRRARIFDFVTLRGAVSVEVLARRFDTSAETIRRDLAVLSDAGQLRKVHGGARAVTTGGEGFFDARMRRNAVAKRLIAEKVVALVKPRQTLFMDTGSTTLICAEALARVKHLTVITNSVRVAATFARGAGGSEVYLLGGQYRADNAQTVGARAVSEITGYRADMAIITIGALDAGGAMDFSDEEAMVARAMLRAAGLVTVLADHTKFDRKAPFLVRPLGAINTLVCDRAPDDALTSALHDAGVKVI